MIEPNAAPPLPPDPTRHPAPTPAIAVNDGMTIGEVWQKVANYRFSTHAFAGISAAAVATYLSSPELQGVVNGFAKQHTKAALIGGAAIAVWRNYAKTQKSLTMTTTVQPGETGATAAVASSEQQ